MATSLREHNRAQIVLWLAQAAQITATQGREDEVDAIYERMMEVLGVDGPPSSTEAGEEIKDRSVSRNSYAGWTHGREEYYCGCVRKAQWSRCDRHKGLDHDEEPPAQRDRPDSGERESEYDCLVCGEPATCIGRYEGHGPVSTACDTCCGHGNEDGWCVPVERVSRMRLADPPSSTEAGEDWEESPPDERWSERVIRHGGEWHPHSPPYPVGTDVSYHGVPHRVVDAGEQGARLAAYPDRPDPSTSEGGTPEGNLLADSILGARRAARIADALVSEPDAAPTETEGEEAGSISDLIEVWRERLRQMDSVRNPEFRALAGCTRELSKLRLRTTRTEEVRDFTSDVMEKCAVEFLAHALWEERTDHKRRDWREWRDEYRGMARELVERIDHIRAGPKHERPAEAGRRAETEVATGVGLQQRP